MTEESKKSKKKPSLFSRFKRDQVVGAERALLEELFNDMHRNRRQVYMMNFFRGVFFGFGSVLGGTLLIAIMVWLLAQLGALVPFLSDFIQQILDTLGRRSA
jgi:hypothetical protein